MKPEKLPLLRVSLDASYGDRRVLNQIHFDLHAGETLGLVGTSGAGKSTLVMALLGLLPWRQGKAAGQVLLEGRDLLAMRERDARRLRGSRIALIPQSPMSALNSAISLRTHFEEAWCAHEKSGHRALESRLATLIPEVQLPFARDFLSRRPGQISVGQAQRVMIALALLHRPAVLIADEPTSALDPVTQSEILRLLRRLNRQTGTALLYISHDLVSVLQLCDRLAVLGAGTIVESVPVAMLGRQVHHPSTSALLDALPVPPGVLLGYRDATHADLNADEDICTCGPPSKPPRDETGARRLARAFMLTPRRHFPPATDSNLRGEVIAAGASHD